jgi:hypothetical protein
MNELKASGKPFQISKQEVWDAWIKVKGKTELAFAGLYSLLIWWLTT